MIIDQAFADPESGDDSEQIDNNDNDHETDDDYEDEDYLQRKISEVLEGEDLDRYKLFPSMWILRKRTLDLYSQGINAESLEYLMSLFIK